MVTKTLILRPFFCTFYKVGTLVSKGTMVPSETAEVDMFLLLNEEDTDDDATYYSVIDTLLPQGILHFMVSNECRKITPTAIRFVIRTKTISSNSSIIPQLKLDLASSDRITLDCPVKNYESYETNSLEVENVDVVWRELLNDTFRLHIGAAKTSSSSSGKSSEFEVRYTQIYIEVDYEDNAGTSNAYIKNGTEWVRAQAVYRKENGVWTECDGGALTQGKQYDIVKYEGGNL